MDAELRAAVLKVAGELKMQLDLITHCREACQGNKTIGWCPNIAMHDGAVAGLGGVFYELVQGARASAELIEEAEKEEEKSMNTPQTELLKTTASTVDIDFDEWMACACANAKAKFVRKRKEGYTGWTDPALWDVFMKGIHKNLAQVESPDTDASWKADALIDIINFAVMAWRITKKEAAQ